MMGGMKDKFVKAFSVKPSMGDGDFIEIDTTEAQKNTAKILVKFFNLTDYNEVKEILDTVRDGYSICLIKVKTLREKDITDLKRAVSKIKRTCTAAQCDVVGIDENYIVTVPDFVDVVKGSLSSVNLGLGSDKRSEY